MCFGINFLDALDGVMNELLRNQENEYNLHWDKVAFLAFLWAVA